MATDTWMRAVTGLYLACNGPRLFAYEPQIAALVKTRQADGISAASWPIFAVAHASTTADAFEMRSDAVRVRYARTLQAAIATSSMRPSSTPWQATSVTPCGFSSGRSALQRALA